MSVGDNTAVLSGKVEVKEVDGEGRLMHGPFEPPKVIQVSLKALPVMALQCAGEVRAQPNAAAEVVDPSDEAAVCNFDEAVAVLWQQCMRLMHV